MNQYEWKQQNRKERLERAAARATTEGNAWLTNAHEMLECIPMGQPILVDHYSAPRHRRLLARSDAAMRRGFARLKEAQELAYRAAAIAHAGISSDDPDAVEKLGEKLEVLVARRDRWKAINAAYRKAKGIPAVWHMAVDPPVSDEEKLEIARNFMYGHTGRPYPSYSLTNLGARIRSAEARVAKLARRTKVVEALVAEGLEVKLRVVNGVEIVEDWPENRIRLRFPRRLTRDEYKQIRQAGFVWSPTMNAFQRKLERYTVDIAERYAQSFDAAPVAAGRVV